MTPVKMVLHCPACGLQHIDADNTEEVAIAAAERGFVHGSRDWENFVEAREWNNPPHRSHLCRPEDGGCGHIWRPADVPTEGVPFIETRGKNDSPKPGPLVPFPEFRNVVDVYPHSDSSVVVSFTSCRTAGVFARDTWAAIIKRRPK